MEKNNLKPKKEKTLIRWDPQEKILYIKILQNIKNYDAKSDTDKISEIFDQIPENETIKILADVSNVSKVWDFGARRVYSEMVKKYKKKPIKAALIGANTLIKLITGFIITVGGRKKFLKFFDNTEDGLKWLKR